MKKLNLLLGTLSLCGLMFVGCASTSVEAADVNSSNETTEASTFKTTYTDAEIVNLTDFSFNSEGALYAIEYSTEKESSGEISVSSGMLKIKNMDNELNGSYYIKKIDNKDLPQNIRDNFKKGTYFAISKNPIEKVTIYSGKEYEPGAKVEGADFIGALNPNGTDFFLTDEVYFMVHEE